MKLRFGGVGGVLEGRPRNEDDYFESAVERALGDRLRVDRDLCERLWGSLSNVTWRHENGDEAGYTFRAAGDLVAAIRGEGDYLDWYCSSEAGVIDEEVRIAMATQGWKPEAM